MSFYGQNICVGVTGWLHYKEEAEYYKVPPPPPTQVFGVGGKPDWGGGILVWGTIVQGHTEQHTLDQYEIIIQES